MNGLLHTFSGLIASIAQAGGNVCSAAILYEPKMPKCLEEKD